MIKIRQHGAAGELNDLQRFMADLDAFFEVEAWDVRIEECLGDVCDEVEALTVEPRRISDKEFRKLYGGIYQTIDGDFHVYGKDGLVAHLLAVDSSYWEVSSTYAFECHMLEKYGKYVYGI